MSMNNKSMDFRGNNRKPNYKIDRKKCVCVCLCTILYVFGTIEQQRKQQYDHQFVYVLFNKCKSFQPSNRINSPLFQTSLIPCVRCVFVMQTECECVHLRIDNNEFLFVLRHIRQLTSNGSVFVSLHLFPFQYFCCPGQT